MNTSQLVVLKEEDFSPFLQGEAVARIFHKTAGWFIGTRRSIKFDKETCLLRLHAFKQLTKIDATNSSDPKDPGNIILPSTAEPKVDLKINELPFRLVNPRKLIDKKNGTNVLIIVADDETAIVSQRPEDIQLVKKLLGHEEI